jgi:hypothetical protein
MRRNVSNDTEARVYTARGQNWPINAVYGQPCVSLTKFTGTIARTKASSEKYLATIVIDGARGAETPNNWRATGKKITRHVRE